MRPLAELDRLPIASTESEMALLAAMLVDPSQIDTVAGELSAADFSGTGLAALYDALVTLHQAGIPLGDVTVLVPELRRANVPDAVCSPVFLGRMLMNGVAGHVRFYAQEVRRASRLRAQEEIGRSLITRAWEVDADPDRIATWLDAATTSVGMPSDDCRMVGEIAAEYIAELRQPKARQRIVMSGVLGLDETIGGFMPGELVVLAARPNVGKTALAMQMACHVAAHGRGVLFVSLEMEDRELVGRILCGTSGVNSQLIRAGEYDDRDIGRLEWAGAKISDYPLTVWDPPRATTTQIRARAKRRAVSSSGLSLLVVDYISLIQPTDHKRALFEQIGQITGDLKAMAKELPVPVLALCQLNRQADGEEPRLSHLRYSGSVEQDADCVLFIHREPKDNTTTLMIAKHRHAPTGSIQLRWVPERTRFENGPTGYEELP